MARGEGNSGVLVVVVLVILAGAGGWNYYRNMSDEISALAGRPFESYSSADLEKLAEAYRGEAAQYRDRLTNVKEQRVEARTRHRMSDRVREFERVQHHSTRTRNLRGEVAGRESRSSEIDAELAYRKRLASGVTMHLERLLGI